MKIIKQGKLPSKKIWTGTCMHCATEIECEQSETKSETHRNETDTWVTCPTCKQQLFVNEKGSR